MADAGPVISGLSLRLPGAANARTAWSVLAEGRCTVSTVSTALFDHQHYLDPHPGRKGRAYTLAAGQIDGIYHFDAGFFGISPREAAQMDPQQRLLLRAAWEAVEDAGLDITRLRGPRTGVWIGSAIVENLTPHYFDPLRGGSAFALGNELSILANRISAQFGFGGPSLVVDTACSSGLYALHLAMQALALGEVDTALVGAVHVVRSPGGFMGFSMARMLSPSGLCRAFDAGADGYVRSEACVMLVLQRADVAAQMGARGRGRVLATGINSDGDATPLMVPSAARQQVLIEEVLARAGRDPEDLSFYEAHGTGTPVGDPAEATSLGQALGQLRRAGLPIGSAKTNFGHAEPAAGLVGLTKALLAFEHGALPASLHFDLPNPAIDFEGLNLTVNTHLTALEGPGPWLAGVNSFGFGGTNAVALVEQYVPQAAPRRVRAAAVDVPGDLPPWLMISAADPQALVDLAGDWAARLAEARPEGRPALAAATAFARAALPQRLALRLDDQAGVRLAALRTDGPAPEGVLRGHAALVRPQTVLAFGGMGTQFVGMGQAEYRADPLWRASFDALAEAFAAEGVPGLADLLFAPDLAARLDQPLVAQPLITACAVATAESLIAAGLRPDAVIGHSLGEIAALHVAGAYDRAALARIVASRARAFSDLCGQGGMATFAATEAEIARALAALGEPDLVIAALNAPRSVTVSGPVAAIDRLAALPVGGRRLAMLRLGTDVPYHSPALDPLHSRLMADLAGVVFAPTRLRVAGAAAGRMLRPTEVDAAYMWRNSRDMVRFAPALAALLAEGPGLVVEVSPRPILAANIRDLARQDGLALEHQPARELAEASAAQATARLWTCGAAVDLVALAGASDGPAPDLPGYRWQETHHHTTLSPDGIDGWGEASSRGLAGLRAQREVPGWVADFTPTAPAWVADHRIGGRALLPAAALAEIALSAAAELWPEAGGLELASFDIVMPAEVQGEGIRIRTLIDPATGEVTLSLRPRTIAAEWALVARGQVRPLAAEAPARHRATSSPATTAPGLADARLLAQLYEGLAARGLGYGKAFRRLSGWGKGPKGTLMLRLASGEEGQRFTLDPMALDAGFHGLAVLLAAGLPGAPPALLRALAAGAALVPVWIGRLVALHPGAVASQARMSIEHLSARGLRLALVLMDAQGREVARLTGVEFACLMPGLGQMRPMRYTARRVRLMPPGAVTALPKRWQKPGRALAALGLRAAPQPSDAAQALAALRGTLASGGDGVAALAQVMAQNPQLAEEARITLAAYRGVRLPEVTQVSASNRAAWDLAERLARDVLRGWPRHGRAAILCLGLPGGAQAARLAALAADGIAFHHPDPAARALLGQTLPGDLAPLIRADLAPGGFDIVLNVGIPELPDAALASGALVLSIEVPGMIAADAGGPQAFHADADPLPLRVTARIAPPRAPEPIAPPRLMLQADEDDEAPALPPALASLAGYMADKPQWRLVPLVVPGPEPVDQALARLLLTLRRMLVPVAPPVAPLIVLAVENADHLDLLAEAASAALRVLSNEQPAIGARLITLSDAVENTAAENTAPENTAAVDWPATLALLADEPALHLRGGAILADRLVPVALPQPPAQALVLEQAEPGRVAALHWIATPRRKPGPGEAEVAITATGLNFRDVMLARGLLPERLIEHGASGAGLGMEWAGRVLRVGAGVGLAPGAPVMGLGRNAFASHLTLPADAVWPVPEGLSLVAAAGLPVAALTASQALIGAARLGPGESVLIHGGAGGVGLAAIAVARGLGARVFATASTPEKRALAQAMGAEATFDSRSPGFAEAVRTATAGRGVDVVLNSLSGAMMQASVGCLAPFGRFVELGKRDFAEATRLDLRPFARGLSYIAFDLDQQVAARPEALRAGFAALAKALAEGRMAPLPVTRFEGAEAPAAMGHMLAARHQGKIVISPPSLSRPGPRARPLRDDWLILGGNGGLGLAVAQRLLARGVARVHLLCRSGEIGPGFGGLDTWARTDPRVQITALDAADPQALSACLDGLEAEGRRVGGVIHAAMVLRDRLLGDLDPVETAAVIRAKLGVGLALDAALRARQHQPDHVLAFTTLASALGNPGQAVYAAANAGVEALMAARQRDGLPGRALAWGPVGDGGALARNATLAARLRSLDGLEMLTTAALLHELERVLDAPNALTYGPENLPGNFGFASLDWGRLAPFLPVLAQAPFGPLVAEGASARRPTTDLVAALKRLPLAAAQARIEAEFRAIVALILRLTPEDVDLRRPLGRYGFDSLMAMELRLEVERRFGRALPVIAMSGEITGARLASQILQQVRGEDD